MPYADPDPSDPSVLVGMSLPADPESDLEMAYVFAEEFARLGHDEERLVRLFQQPFYAGAYRLWCALGEGTIRQIIRDTLAAWGTFRCVTSDAPAGIVRLRVPCSSQRTRDREEDHEQGL